MKEDTSQPITEVQQFFTARQIQSQFEEPVAAASSGPPQSAAGSLRVHLKFVISVVNHRFVVGPVYHLIPGTATSITVVYVSSLSHHLVQWDI